MTREVRDAEWEEVAEGGTDAPSSPTIHVRTRRVRYEPRERQAHRPGEAPRHWLLIRVDSIEEALAITGRPSNTPVRHAFDPISGTGVWAVWSGTGAPDHSAAFPWEQPRPQACTHCAGTGWEFRVCPRCKGTALR